VTEVLVVLDAEIVEVATASIGEIGVLEAARRVRQRDVLYVPAAIGALERTETGIGGETASRGALNYWNRHDELVLVIEHPCPDEERPALEVMVQRCGELAAFVRRELRRAPPL